MIGDSAGGYLSLRSAFLFPWADIKAINGQYCLIYPDANWISQPAEVSPEVGELIDTYTSQTAGTIHWPVRTRS